MFPPSTYCSLGPYPYFPSSSSSSSYPSSFTSFLNPENASSNNNTFLHDPLSIPYTVLPTNTTTHHHVPIPETITNWTVADHYAAMLKQDLSGGGSGSGVHYGSISNLLTKKPAKKPVKKDRHSKIHTSQGLRDRRVRLSIEIARKFFDLQDMLGFDKASNTLEWLFNKSKKAIEDLTRIKQHSSSAAADDHSFSSSSSEGEVYSNDISERVDFEERKLKKAQMKESREKARARARERTSGKEKEKSQPETDENPQMFHQLRPDVGGGSGEFQRDDIFNFIEESIVIKRKLKKSSESHNHQTNLMIPKEASYDNSDCHSSPMSPNWDANNAPNTLTMNLSAGQFLSFFY